MVKLFGPALSLDASGTVADAVTFSKWKGRNYLRERSKPSNPRTGLQLGTRAMFKFLTQNWAALSPAQIATWQNLANAKTVTTFNAYVAENLSRWRRFQGPSKLYPATEAGLNGGWLGGTAPNANSGRASITIQWQTSVHLDTWALLIFRGSTGFTPALSNCLAGVLSNADFIDYSWLDSPLAAGTYFYNTIRVTDDGLMASPDGEISAAAT